MQLGSLSATSTRDLDVDTTLHTSSSLRAGVLREQQPQLRKTVLSSVSSFALVAGLSRPVKLSVMTALPHGNLQSR
jgi:hypothetical protein